MDYFDYTEDLENYVYEFNHSSQIEVTRIDDTTYSAKLSYCDGEIEGHLGRGSVVELSFVDVHDATEEMGEPGFSFIMNFVSCSVPGIEMDADVWNPTTDMYLLEEVVKNASETVMRIFRDGRLGEPVYMTIS